MKRRGARICVCIMLSLLLAAVSGVRSVGVAAGKELSLIEQQKLARNLFNKIAAKDQWDLKGIEPLFLEVIEKAPV